MKTTQHNQRRGPDDLRYPAEVITGLALGCLAAAALLAVVFWLLSKPEMAGLRSSIADPSSPAFFAAWIGVGLLTALLVTAGFVLSARFYRWRESRLIQARAAQAHPGFLPVTGEDQDEDPGEE